MPSPAVVIVRKRQRAELAFSLLHLACGVAVLTTAAGRFDAFTAVGIYAVVVTLLLLAYELWLLRLAGQVIGAVLPACLRECLLAAAVLSPVAVDSLLFAGEYTPIAALLSTNLVLYRFVRAMSGFATARYVASH